MKTVEKKRCLAYTLSKEVTYEELSEVSGGGGLGTQISTSIGWTHKNGEWDGGIDVKID